MDNVVVKNWEELAAIEPQESDTHTLSVDLDMGLGRLRPKNEDCKVGRRYLSTHSFYQNSRKGTEYILRECGFNITVTENERED